MVTPNDHIEAILGDHIEAILDGLCEDYDTFVMSVTSCLDPYIIEEIEALMFAQEECFE